MNAPAYIAQTDIGHLGCAFVYEPRAIGGVLHWTDRYVSVSAADAPRIEQLVVDDNIEALLAYLAEHPAPAPCKCASTEVVL